MIILDKPYTSDVMKSYLEESRIPVLDNAEARAAGEGRRFNILSDDAFAEAVNGGRRLYTTSENALDWVQGRVTRRNIADGVASMKDKHRMRRALAPMYPGFYFAEATFEELTRLDPASVPYPVVLKPVVGFFSLGVHVLNSAADLAAAREAIARERQAWRRAFPEGVVGMERFILEQYIAGDEFALDAYFDRRGEAVVLNLMRHDFSSAEDVSDRLYYTDAGTIRDNLDRFTDFLNRTNRILGITDFPFHVEVRAQGDAIVPIEFNPLRFAGYCTTDLAYFAYGVRTCEYYLDDRRPDWNALLAGKEDDLYSLVILDKPRGAAAGAVFDYDAVRRHFTEVLCLRKFEAPKSSIYGIMFTRTPRDRRQEMDSIMRSDLREFVRD